VRDDLALRIRARKVIPRSRLDVHPGGRSSWSRRHQRNRNDAYRSFSGHSHDQVPLSLNQSGSLHSLWTASLSRAMGSLIKKRRKRMRKKKHKKMLKRTRWQRRAK